MIIPSITKLNIPELISTAAQLATEGVLRKSKNNLIYLDIDDNYINRLFPLLEDKSIQKPNYFGKGLIGAHISIIYPEEQRIFKPEDLNKNYSFQIKELVKAEINLKNYVVLLINSPELVRLRNKYHLDDQLNFKNHLIDLHITIGVKPKH